MKSYLESTNNISPIYMDTEFTSLTKDAELLSIGLISEDNEYFYAEITDADHSKINDWIQNNVIKNFINNDIINDNEMKVDYNENGFVIGYRYKGTREQIALSIKNWLANQYKKYNKKLQIYADVLAYDWVLFIDLIAGDSINLPEYIYYIPYDLSSILNIKGYDPDYNREAFISNYNTMINNGNISSTPVNVKIPLCLEKRILKHNALWDAYITKYIFKIIENNDVIK